MQTQTVVYVRVTPANYDLNDKLSNETTLPDVNLKASWTIVTPHPGRFTSVTAEVTHPASQNSDAFFKSVAAAVLKAVRAAAGSGGTVKATGYQKADSMDVVELDLAA